MHSLRVIEALKRSPQALGVLPELAALRPTFDIHVYESLASTNREAWHLVEQGAGAGTVVIAQAQTAGRGQRGRTWASEPGGLYLSLVLEPELAIADAALLTLMSTWGVVRALECLGAKLQIKWPNDLIYRGQKVGGILTESRIGPALSCKPSELRLRHAVVGIGLNWDNPLPANAVSLRQLLPDHEVTPVKDLADLAAIALRGIHQGYHYYQQRGRAAFLVAYQHKLSHLGKRIVVNGHTAVVKSVSNSGDLVLEIHKNGKKTIQSLKPGEISLGYNT